MFKTKSVHSAIEPRKDGLRILAARGRGRSVPKDRYDIWMANLGPSEQLRNEFLAGKITWPEYRDRYGRELREGGTIDRRNKRIKNSWPKIHSAPPAISCAKPDCDAAVPLRRRRAALPPAPAEEAAREEGAVGRMTSDEW